MVSSVAASKHVTLALAARVPAPVANVVASVASQAGTSRKETRPAKSLPSLPATASSTAMAALLKVQEKHEAKKPKPHEPAPSPAPTPTPTPPVAVVDDSAPVRFLESVREQLHAEPVSQFPDKPFSQRDERPTSPTPAAPAGLGAFYTPGVFTAVQATAMRATTQATAGLLLLQAGQASLYAQAASGPNPFRISAFA